MARIEFQKPIPVGQQGIKDYPKDHMIQPIKELEKPQPAPKAPTKPQ